MANIYSEGKIYKIIGGNETYIGSTIQTLDERFKRHTTDYGMWLNGKPTFVSSFQLFDKYGIQNCKINILEPFPCETKQQLREREGYWQRQEVCVNMLIAGRTQKQYNEDNKEKIQEKKKQYWEKNKEKLLEQQKIPYECECGSVCRRADKTKHFKTKKHLDYIKLK